MPNWIRNLLNTTPANLKTTRTSTRLRIAELEDRTVPATLTWDATVGGAINDGAGAWLNPNQWNNGAPNATWTSGDDAIFGVGGTGGAVTLAGPTTVNSLTMNAFSGTYTLGTAGQTITLNNGITKNAGSGAVTFAGPLTLGAAQTWTNNSTGTLTTSNGTNLIDNGGHQLTVDGTGVINFGVINNAAEALTGSGNLIKNGTGRLNIGGNNTGFSGTVTVNGGVMQVHNVNEPIGLGNLTLNGGVMSFYWGANYTRTLGTGNSQVQILGGESGFAGAGTTGPTINLGPTIVWGASGEGSATGFFNPSKFVLGDAGTGNAAIMTFSSGINLNGVTRTLVVPFGTSAGGNRSTISGAINNSTGTAGLIKEGGGMLNLTNNTSAWNGTTTVSAGVLDMGGINLANIGGGTGRNISVASGAGVRFNTLSNAVLNRLVETTDEIGVMTATTSNNLDFSSSTGANLPNAFLGNWAGNGAKAEISGTITPGSDGYKFGARGSSGLLGIRDTLSGVNDLTVGQTGSSGIRVNIVAANTHTGETVINSGARLTLGHNLALQNSPLNVGAAGGNFSLAAGNNAGRIAGETAAPSPTFGGLIGSRNLSAVFSNGAGNNETNLAAVDVTGFTLNVGTGNTFTYTGAIGGFGAGTSNINSGGINGSSTLTKTGAGTQILTGVHTYTGQTTVNGGRLSIASAGNINSTSNISIGNGNFDYSTSIPLTKNISFSGTGGTLSGSNGTITTAVTITNGNTLSPGTAGIGTLNFSASPILGGTVFAEINKSGMILTADKVNVTAPLTYGGTLDVSASGNTLALGDTFDLFDATAFSGSFSTINLPPAPSGLAWDTTQLTVDGTIKVVPAGTISATLSGGNLTITDTDGTKNNTLSIVRSGSDIVVTDTSGEIFAETGTNTYTIAAATVTGTITINGSGGNDKLTVNLSGGALPTINYNGGASGNDGLIVMGNGTQTATYTPSATTMGDGVVVTSAGTINFSNLEPVDITGMLTATLSLPNADDAITLTDGVDYLSGGTNPAIRATGTSGAATIESAAFWNNTNVVIDTTASNGNDTITIASATVGNNANLSIITSTGADTDNVNINGPVNVTGSVAINTVNVNSTGAGTITTGTGLTVTNTGTSSTLAGNINGTGATLTKAGTGTVTLGGTNGYTGATNVNAGIVRISTASAVSGTSLINVSSGGTFDVNAQAINTKPFNIAGAGASGQLGAIVNTTGGPEAQIGNTTLTANASVGTSGSKLNFSGGGNVINGGGFTLTVNGSGETNIRNNNALTNLAGISVNTTGSGRLRLESSQAPSSVFNITVNAGAILDSFDDRTYGANLGVVLNGGTLGAEGPGADIITWNGPVTVNAPSTVLANRRIDFFGLINGGAGATDTITKSGSDVMNVRGGVGSALEGLTISAGRVRFENTGFGAWTGPITINSSGILSGWGTQSTTANIVANGGTLSVESGAGTVSYNGTLSVTAPSVIAAGAGMAVTIGGAISGSSGLTKNGTGTTTFSASSPSFTGTTTVAAGTLTINGSIANSTVTVQSSATLMGTGTTGPLTINVGGTHAPGNSPGITTVAGNYTENGALVIEIATPSGAVAGTDYDQVNVTAGGLVNIGGTATLSVPYLGTAGTFNPPVGQAYTIINNDLADTVTGTFSGLPAGTNVAVDTPAKNLKIYYNGGDGNDVVLVSANGTPSTLYVNDQFTTASMVDGDAETAGFQTAYVGIDAFASITAALAAYPSYSGPIVVNGGTYASVALAGGGNVTLRLVQDLTYAEPNITVQALTGDATDAIATRFNNVANANLIVDNAAAASFAGVISGAGSLTKNGAGTLTLSGANTYGGTTSANAGVVEGVVGGTVAVPTNPFGTSAISIDGGTVRYNRTVALDAGITRKRVTPTATPNTVAIDYDAVGTTHIDTQISGTAGAPAGLGVGHRWTGLINVVGGNYAFRTNSDDGSRLYIDGVLVVTNDGSHGAQNRTSSTITLSAGLHSVVYYYAEGTAGGNGPFSLSWAGPETGAITTFQVVPASAFFQSTPISQPNPVTVTTNGGGLDVQGNMPGLILPTLNIGAAGTTNFTATSASSRRIDFTTTNLTATGATVNISNDQFVGLGRVVDGANTGITLNKQGAGQLILDNTAATPNANDLNGTTLRLTAGKLVAMGTGAGSSTVPIAGAPIEIAGGTLTLDSKVNSFTFTNPITVTSSGTIEVVPGNSTIQQSTGLVTINAGQALTVRSYGGNAQMRGGLLQINGQITGAGDLIKTNVQTNTEDGNTGNTGFLLLNNNTNNYSGTTTISGGSLIASVSNALGATSGDTLVQSGGQLRVQNTITLPAGETVTINGTGPGSGGALRNENQNNTVTDAVLLSGAATIVSATGATTLSLPGGINVTNGAVTFDGNGNTTVTGNISRTANTNGVTKNGTGTLTLGGASSDYQGVTTINTGTVVVTANNALGTAAGRTVVQEGTSLVLSGGVAYTTAEPLHLRGLGVVSGTGLNAPQGALRSQSGNNSFDGPITVGDEANLLTGNPGARIVSATAGNTLTLGGTLTSHYPVVIAGDGNTTVNGAISGVGADNYRPGLLAGFAGASFEENAINPAMTVQLGVNAGQTQTGGGNPWADNRTWIYTGQFFDADGIFAFAENIDDNVLIKIDGVTRLRNTTWNQPTTTGSTTNNPNGGVTNFGMGPNGDGWHDIEIRLGNGGGGAGAVAGTGWTSTFGFGLNASNNLAQLTSPNGSVDGYSAPVDPGNATLFRTRGYNSLTKQGNGTLTLAGNNTYSGETTIEAGTVVVGHNNALGTPATGNNGSTTIISGATLSFPGGVSTPASENLTVDGSGTGTGVILSTGTNTIGGNITAREVSSGTVTIGSVSGLLTINGGVNLNYSALNVSGAGNVTIDGAVSGVGASTNRTYTQEVLADNPIGFWQFNELGDVAFDSSGLNNAAQVFEVSRVAGRTGAGAAMSYDGAGDISQVLKTELGSLLSVTGNNQETISLWVNGNVAAQPRAQSTFGGYSTPGIGGSNQRVAMAHLPWSDSIVYWDSGDPASTTNRTQTAAQPAGNFEGAWNNWVFVKNGVTDTSAIYLNGALVVQETGTETGNLNNLLSLFIGGGDAGSFFGLIDDFAIYNTALSGARIATIYAADTTPQSSLLATNNLTKSGTGTLTLGGTNTYNGTTTVNDGTLLVNGSLADGTSTPDVIVNNAAVLGGTGTINGTVQLNNTSRLSPGTSVESLATGTVTWNSGTFFDVELDGTAGAGVVGGHDILNVTGGVNLGGATLNLSGTLVPNPATIQKFVIIDNDGSDAVTGTFAGLPEGSEINFGGGKLYLSYYGDATTSGAGNDVVLYSQPVINGTPGADIVTVTPADAAGNITITYSLNNGGITGSITTTAPPHAFTFSGGGDDDTLNVLLNSFTALPGGITYNGEGQSSPANTGGNPTFGDVLHVQGTGSQTATYLSHPTIARAGTINATGLGTISFAGLEPVNLFGMATANVNFSNSNDVIAIDNGFGATVPTAGDPAMVVSGTSNAVVFEQVHLRNNTTVHINTVTGGVDGNDTITVNSASNAHGNTNLTINTGTGSDSVTFLGNATVTGAAVVNSQAIAFNGGTLSATTSANLNAGTGAITTSGTGLDVSTPLLSATATTGIDLDTTVANIVANNTGVGNITIDETDGATVQSVTASNGSATITTATNDLLVSSVLVTGTATLTATTGAITDNNGAGNNIAATSLVASAVTGIEIDTQVTNITATNTGAGNISIDEGNGANVLNVAASNGTATVTSATGDLNVTTMSASTTATLTATTGAITDANGPTNNITATSFAATASTGIATSGNPLETTVTNLEAGTSTGGIFITNTGTLNIGNVNGTLNGIDVTGASGDVSTTAQESKQ